MVMDLSRQVCVIFLRCFENNLHDIQHEMLARPLDSTNLGPVCKVVLCQVDLAKGALSNEFSQRVVANMP
jgi:hypothetical protein